MAAKPPTMIPVAEAVRMSGLSRQSIYRLYRGGALQGRGGPVLISRASLARYLRLRESERKRERGSAG